MYCGQRTNEVAFEPSIFTRYAILIPTKKNEERWNFWNTRETVAVCKSEINKFLAPSMCAVYWLCSSSSNDNVADGMGWTIEALRRARD